MGFRELIETMIGLATVAVVLLVLLMPFAIWKLVELLTKLLR